MKGLIAECVQDCIADTLTYNYPESVIRACLYFALLEEWFLFVF